MIPTEDFTDVTLASEDTDDYDDHDGYMKIMMIRIKITNDQKKDENGRKWMKKRQKRMK